MIAYFISGLGADKRIFENIRLSPQIGVVHISWLEPEKDETLSHYCERMKQQIQPEEDFVLIGMSFGGIVSVELSKMLQPKEVIIISAVATRTEFPLQFHIARWLRLHQIVPLWVLKLFIPVLYWFFGAHLKEERKMLRHFLYTVTPYYMKWSMNAVLNWKNEERPKNLYHIHGTADKIFPVWRTHPDVKIEGAGHFMAYDRAEEISRILDWRLRIAD